MNPIPTLPLPGSFVRVCQNGVPGLAPHLTGPYLVVALGVANGTLDGTVDVLMWGDKVVNIASWVRVQPDCFKPGLPLKLGLPFKHRFKPFGIVPKELP